MADSVQQTVIKNPSWWRRRSAMERGLTLVATVALMVAAALAISLGVLVARRQHQSESLAVLAAESGGDVSAPAGPRGPHDVCLTPGCVHAASVVLDKMDPSVDPCDDFYEYACGRFTRTTLLAEDEAQVDALTTTGDLLLQQVRAAIEEVPQGPEPRAFQLVRALYAACMDQAMIESRGVLPLQRLLQGLGGWPAVQGDAWDQQQQAPAPAPARAFRWWDTVHRLHRAGYSVDYLIDFSVVTHPLNSSRRTIDLDQPPLGINREFLVRGPSDPLVAAYYHYQVDLAVLLGADRARAEREMRHSLDFEIALANMSASNEERRNLTQLYNPRTLQQLQAELPSVPWLQVLQPLLPPNITLSNDELVVISAPSYLMQLEALLKHTPSRVVANYMLWRAAADSVRLLTEELRAREMQFAAAASGRSKRGPRWKECVGVASRLSLAVGSMYVRKYFRQESKKAALEMVDDIRSEFLHILEEVDWMDPQTRQKGLEKARAMAAHIAYPEELLGGAGLDRFYQQLEVSRALYLESVLNVTRFETSRSFGLLREPVNKTAWTTHGQAAAVKASYNFVENSIKFPAAILQGAFFSADRPQYMNYGAIGFVIGHEITHGFDDQGRQRDTDGNLVDWWDPVTSGKFLQKVQCVISQYDNYIDEQTGMHLNGANTQGENVADNGGLKLAYRAYLAAERRAGRPQARLPALAHLSPRQLFWLAAAHNWCSKYRNETLAWMITTRVHSPGRFRVLGPLSNRPEFAEDFGCPLGSRMNPVDKCHVW